MKKNQSYSTSKSRFTKNQSSNLTHQTIKGPADINQHYTLVPKKFDEFDEKTYKKLLHDKHYSQIEFYNLLGSNINRLEISKFKQFNQLSPSIICYYLNYLSEYNSYIKQNYFFDFFQYQNTYDAENELSYEFFEQERKYLKNKFVIEGQHQFIITFIQIQSNFWVLLAFSIMDQVIEIYSFKQELSEEQIEFTVDCFIDYVEDKYEFISRKTNLNKENNEQVIQAQTKNLAINTDGGLLCLSKLLIILEIVPNTSFINEQQLVSFVHNIKFNLLDMVDQYLKYTKQYLKDIKNQNQIQPFTQDKKNDKNIGKFPNKTSRNQAIDFYSDFKEEFKDKNQFQQQRIQNQNLQQNQSDINTISQFIRQESPIIQNQYRNTMPQNSSQVYIKLKQIQEFDKNQYQTLSEQNQLQKLLKKKLYAENVKLQSNNVLEQFFYQQSMEEQLLAMFLNYISRQSEYIQQRVFMDILVGDKLMIQETDLKVLDNPYSKYLIRQPLQENLQLQLYLYIKIGDLFWVLLVLDLQKNEIFFFNYKISLDLQQIQNITEHTLDYLEKKYEFIKLDDEPKLVVRQVPIRSHQDCLTIYLIQHFMNLNLIEFKLNQDNYFKLSQKQESISYIKESEIVIYWLLLEAISRQNLSQEVNQSQLNTSMQESQNFQQQIVNKPQQFRYFKEMELRNYLNILQNDQNKQFRSEFNFIDLQITKQEIINFVFYNQCNLNTLNFLLFYFMKVYPQVEDQNLLIICEYNENMEEFSLQAMNEFQSFNDMQRNKQPYEFINVFVKCRNKWIYVHYDIKQKKFSVYNCNSCLSLDQIQELVEFLIQFLEDHYNCDSFPNDIYINNNQALVPNQSNFLKYLISAMFKESNLIPLMSDKSISQKQVQFHTKYLDWLLLDCIYEFKNTIKQFRPQQIQNLSYSIQSNDSKILNVTSSSINSSRTLNSELSYSQQINTNKEAKSNVQKLRQYKEAVAQGKIQEHKKTQSLALHRRQFPVDYDELVDLTDEKQMKKIRKQPFQYYQTKVPYDASPGNFQNRINTDTGNFIKQNNSNLFSSMSQDSRLTKSQYISPRLKQPTQISNQSYIQPGYSQFQQEHKQLERSVINQIKNLKNDPQKYKFFKKNVPELNYLVKQIKNMQQKYQLQDSVRSKNSQFNSQNYVQKLRDLRNLIDQQTDMYNKQNPVRFLQNQNQKEVVFQNKFIKNNPGKQILFN